MTQEEKAKRYDEAIERAKDLHDNHTLGQPFIYKTCEDIFPELNENNDERVKKEIIQFLQLPHPQFVGKRIQEEWIAWLEKQGEQKPAWCEKEKVRIDRIINVLDWAEEKGRISYSDLEDYVTYVKSLKPQNNQNPAWSEEDEPQKELAETYLAVFDKKFPILPTLEGKKLADYKNFLNKCQQILGLKYWSIRPLQAKLFEKLSLLWAAWGAEHLKGLGQTNEDTDNKNHAWSEEDEEEANYIADFIENLIKKEKLVSKKTIIMEEMVDWLRALRPPYLR